VTRFQELEKHSQINRDYHQLFETLVKLVRGLIEMGGNDSPSHRLYDVVVSYGMFDESRVKQLEGEIDIFARAFRNRKLNLIIGDHGVPEEDIFSPVNKNRQRGGLVTRTDTENIHIEAIRRFETSHIETGKEDEISLHQMSSDDTLEQPVVEEAEEEVIEKPESPKKQLQKKFTIESNFSSVIKVPEGCKYNG
jgi:hypothetical protein